MGQLSLDHALDRDPLGLELVYSHTPFDHYSAQARALALSGGGDTEEEALRELALHLRRWAFDGFDQELTPGEPNFQWHERSLARRLLEAADLDESISLLRRLTGPVTLSG